MAALLAKKKNAELSRLSLADISNDLWHAHGKNARTQKCGIKALLKRGYSLCRDNRVFILDKDAGLIRVLLDKIL